MKAWQIIAGLVGGYAFWTLCEYWIHRVVFHFEPEKGFGARLHWIIHGVHHDHPNDPLRLVMPPSVSVPLATLFYLGFVGIGGAARGVAAVSGVIGGLPLFDNNPHPLPPPPPPARGGGQRAGPHLG